MQLTIVVTAYASLLWAVSAFAAAEPPPPDSGVLIEAEAFAQHGGWVVDPQFMDQMGSPFLLAHGLGVPVADAVTTVEFPAGGDYRVWVRTRDWVAPWQAPACWASSRCWCRANR